MAVVFDGFHGVYLTFLKDNISFLSCPGLLQDYFLDELLETDAVQKSGLLPLNKPPALNNIPNVVIEFTSRTFRGAANSTPDPIDWIRLIKKRSKKVGEPAFNS